MDNKIKDQKELIAIVEELRRQGKKIVTYNGSFDILHIGHIKSLKEAKEQGDVLAVLINSDESVRKCKGPNHPINSQKDRAENLAALECVDYVATFDEINSKAVLDKIKPNIHCNGQDWGESCVERGIIEKNGGSIHILKWQAGLSTSGFIKKILDIHAKEDVKAVFIDRDGTINTKSPGYVCKISDFKFMPGVVAALKELSKTGYKIIVITNQSGIARGQLNEKDLSGIHGWMVGELNKEGARIDRIYYCPHHPDGGCLCRKPAIGMFLKAAEDFGINLSKSWMIGDDARDVVAGREANIRTIKLGEKMPEDLKLEPNHYASDLPEAIKIILN